MKITKNCIFQFCQRELTPREKGNIVLQSITYLALEMDTYRVFRIKYAAKIIMDITYWKRI